MLSNSTSQSLILMSPAITSPLSKTRSKTSGRLSEWALRATEAASYVRVTGMNTIDSLINGRPDIFLDALRHLVLPIISLSYLSWALILRVTRSSMLEALRQDPSAGQAQCREEQFREGREHRRHITSPCGAT